MIPSISIPRLSDADLERLDRLLEAEAVPHDGMSLEMLDGFLSALITGPELVGISEYWREVWNRDPTWADQAAALDAHRLVSALWNDIAARLQIELPDDDDESAEAYQTIETAMPLLAFPANDDGDESETAPELDADFPLAAAWAVGFMRGVSLRSDAWGQMEDDEPELGEQLHDIARLAVLDGEDAEHLGLDADDVLDLNQRMQIAGGIPVIMQNFNSYRLEHLRPEPVQVDEPPGRNEPCPCGSGKKFKKCCGDPARLN